MSTYEKFGNMTIGEALEMVYRSLSQMEVLLIWVTCMIIYLTGVYVTFCLVTSSPPPHKKLLEAWSKLMMIMLWPFFVGWPFSLIVVASMSTWWHRFILGGSILLIFMIVAGMTIILLKRGTTYHYPPRRQ